MCVSVCLHTHTATSVYIVVALVNGVVGRQGVW